MMSEEILYIVTSIFNPEGTKIRYKLYRDFENYINSFPNVILLTVELAFENKPFMVTSETNSHHFQFRTNDIMWFKENLNNIIFKWLYENLGNIKVAWIDADIAFENKNWVTDTLRYLDNYKFVQMLGSCDNLGPRNEVLSFDHSFVYYWKHGSATPKKRGRSGLAWASTTETLNQIGYLMDWDILGASDWTQAFVLTNQSNLSKNACSIKNNEYALCVKELINANVSYIPGKVFHFFHGYSSNRGYTTRGQILIKHQFDPYVDIGYREDGLLYFSSDKPFLRSDIIQHFKSKQEHGPEGHSEV